MNVTYKSLHGNENGISIIYFSYTASDKHGNFMMEQNFCCFLFGCLGLNFETAAEHEYFILKIMFY